MRAKLFALPPYYLVLFGLKKRRPIAIALGSESLTMLRIPGSPYSRFPIPNLQSDWQLARVDKMLPRRLKCHRWANLFLFGRRTLQTTPLPHFYVQRVQHKFKLRNVKKASRSTKAKYFLALGEPSKNARHSN